MDELVEDGLSIPSGTVKEELLTLIESEERSVEVLAKVLKTDTARYATVHELVSNYEECCGQVSLDTWKYVLQQLGYLEYFQQLVVANQMIADVTDIDDLDDEPSLAENNCGARCILRKWPEWSLPPPDESVLKENAEEDAAKGDNDHDSIMQVAAENGPSHENNRIPSNIQSLSQANSSTLGLVPIVENGRSQRENSAVAEIEGREEKPAASSFQADYKPQLGKTTPSRPTTPEAPRSSRDSLVTGQHRSHQKNAVAEAHPPNNDEQDLNNSDQESGNPAEHDHIENNNGLFAELQKANESLLLNGSYLVEELRKKDLVCASLQTNCNQLQQQLEESRGQYAQLQVINEEFRRRLEESTVLEAESQRLIRMTHEICIWKEQECNRLEEHIRQVDQRYDNSNCRMEDLRRKNQELSEELRLAVNQMRDVLRERDHNLQREREQLRLQFEERMAEVARAFNKAETDKVKRLKQKLAREKSKSKTLLEENHQLKALVEELRSKKEGHFPSGFSCEDHSEDDVGEDDVGENPESRTIASSEVEGDEQPGSSNYTQQSDSDSSSEDDRLEDAGDASADAT